MDREYLAYISYRHTPVDKEAAISIQRRLEHYRIPKPLRKDGKARLGIVFRDTDELNISPDLSQSLCTALDNSEYLIVLCSPEYKESEWCRQEIVYFLKHHDIDNILPVLVNGTPSEAFPEEIVRRTIVDGKEIISEPLAANVAGESIKEMKQNIKREYLRLVAKLLGCHYDELVQRQRRYERKQKTVVLGTAFTVLLAFVILLLVKNAQVNSRYQEVRRSQAQYLSKLALEQYAEGDAKSALESILKILPEGDEEGPVVPEQMYALSTALNAYNDSFVPKNFIPLPENEHKVFSNDMAYLFSYSTDLLNVYEVESGKLCYSFIPSKYLKDHPEIVEEYIGLKQALITGVAPTENGKFLVETSFYIFELDINDPSHFRFIAPNGLIFCYKNGKLAVYSKNSINVYDCASGKILYQKELEPDGSPVTYTAKAMCWNENANLLAVGLDYRNKAIQPDIDRQDAELNEKESEYFRSNPPLGLIVIDTSTGKMTTLSSRRTTEVSFADNTVCAVHKEYLPYAPSNTGMAVPSRWFASIYDVDSQKQLYQSDIFLADTYNSFGFSKETVKISSDEIDGNERSVYNLWLGKMNVILDAETMDIFAVQSFRADIIGIVYHRSKPMIFLSNGSILLMSLTESRFSSVRVMKLDTVAKQVVKSDENYYLLTNTGMIHCGLSKWKETVSVTSENDSLKDYQAEVFRYFDSEMGKLRLVGYESTNLSNTYRSTGSYSALEIYKCLGEKSLFSYIADDPNNIIKDCCISKDGDNIFILEQKSDESVLLSCFNIWSGEIKYSSSLPTKLTDSGVLDSIRLSGFSENGEQLWVIRKEPVRVGKDTVHIYDIDEKVVCRTEYQSDNNINYATPTGSEQHLIWLEKDSEAKSNVLVFMDAETGEVKTTKLPDLFDLGSFNCTLLPSQGETVVAYDNGTEVLVFDAEKGSFVRTIQIPHESKIGLLGNKTELLTACEETVSLYDLQTGECKSQLDVPYNIDKLITDSESDTFAISIGATYTSENDNGWLLGRQYLISIDGSRNMYLSACILRGTYDSVSPSGGEIISSLSDRGFEFKRVLSFEGLMTLVP